MQHDGGGVEQMEDVLALRPSMKLVLRAVDGIVEMTIDFN
jgi:hypothetical protein